MSNADTTDEPIDPLLARLRAGDLTVFGEWLHSRRGPLLAYIERRLGGALRRKIEPDDLAQDVSAEAIRSVGQVDLAQRDPFGWLCQIAERRIVDAHRKFFGSQKRDASRELPLDAGASSQCAGLVDMLVASMTSASQAFSRDQRHIRLNAALDSLPEEQRLALRMRYLEGLASKEIAEKLKKTDGAVRVMLTRALDRLQQVLGG